MPSGSLGGLVGGDGGALGEGVGAGQIMAGGNAYFGAGIAGSLLLAGVGLLVIGAAQKQRRRAAAAAAARLGRGGGGKGGALFSRENPLLQRRQRGMRGAPQPPRGAPPAHSSRSFMDFYG